MPQSKRGRVLFALFTCIAIVLIGRNLYWRNLTASCIAAIDVNNFSKVYELLQEGAFISADHADRDSALARTAASDRKTQSLELLLQRGADANASTPAGRPLVNAVRTGNTEAVRILLAHHADPDAPHGEEQSALKWAVQQSTTYPEIVQLLCNSGAHLTIDDAVQVGDLAEVKAYLARGGSPEQSSHGGQPLLTLAAENGRSNIVQALLAAGANVNRYNNPIGRVAETPLSAAVFRGDLETIRVLLKAGADVNIRLKYTAAKNEQTSYTSTPLLYAAQAGRLEVVRLLLDHGANPKPGSVNADALSLAITATGGSTTNNVAWRLERQNRTEIARLLIQAGAEVNPLGAKTPSPLSRACNFGYAEIVMLLLEHGAAVNKNTLGLALAPGSLTGMGGQSFADRMNQRKIVRLLLSKHADVNVALTKGITALMLAAEQEDVEIVQMLFAHNADIHAVTQDGRTVLGFAYSPLPGPEGIDSSAEKSMIALLRSHGLHLTLLEAIRFGEVSDLKTYLAQGVDVNTVSPTGVPLLQDVAANGQAEVMTLLLDHGAKVDSTDPKGWTALMVAAANGKVEIARLLLAHGADRNHKNKAGKTALMEAQRQNRNDLTALLTPPSR